MNGWRSAMARSSEGGMSVQRFAALLGSLGVMYVAGGHVWGASQAIAQNTLKNEAQDETIDEHKKILKKLEEIHAIETERKKAQDEVIEKLCRQHELDSEFCATRGFD